MREDLTPSFDLHRYQSCKWYTGIHADKTLIYKKIINNKNKRTKAILLAILPQTDWVKLDVTLLKLSKLISIGRPCM